MRILVTGSRDWTDRAAIEKAFKDFGPDGWFTVVHGHCPTGADAIADHVARSWGCEVERHPADWKTHGKRAGFVRNAEMVATAPDLCLAFIKNGSRGASMTADIAERAGIPTERFVA